MEKPNENNYICARWRDAVSDPPPAVWGGLVRNDGRGRFAYALHEIFQPGDQWLDVTNIPAWPAAISIEDNEVINALRSLCEFAYEQGFHELGYDPVEEVAKRLNKAKQDVIPREKVQAAVDEMEAARSLEFRSSKDGGGPCCHGVMEGYAESLKCVTAHTGVTPKGENHERI